MVMDGFEEESEPLTGWAKPAGEQTGDDQGNPAEDWKGNTPPEGSETCPRCDGVGNLHIEGEDGAPICPVCEGTGAVPIVIPPSPEVLAQTQIRKDAAMDRMIGNVIPIPEHFRPGSKQERAFIAGWQACREAFAERFGKMVGL